jgi:acyl carrier protein
MVKKEVLNIIADQIDTDVSELSAHMSLFDDLSLDQEELLSICSLIEDAFDIEFDDAFIEDVETIQDIIQYTKDSI